MYFPSTIPGGQGQTVVEWRLFDPTTKTDTLLHSFGGNFMYWDTTESTVEYVSGGTLVTMPWQYGVEPWPVVSLAPASGLADWWYNPDSLCWQTLAVGGVPRSWPRGGPPFGQCYTELWQSDHEGARWHIARADTTDCGGCYFCEASSKMALAAIRRRPAISLWQLRSSSPIDRWSGTLEAISPPSGEPAGVSWYFIPLSAAPGRGLGMRIRYRSGSASVLAPLYMIDRQRGTQKLLETPWFRRDEPCPHMGIAEHDGYVLISGDYRNYVFDVKTGEQLLPQSGILSGPAVWIKSPAPASIDTAGLRRLRARFR